MLISPYRWHAMRWTMVLFLEMTLQTLLLAYTSYSHEWTTRITYVMYVPLLIDGLYSIFLFYLPLDCLSCLYTLLSLLYALSLYPLVNIT